MGDCCFRAKHPDPFPLDIVPGQAVRVVMQFKARAGPFHADLEAHFEEAGRLKTVDLPVAGEVAR